jgi:hypothetical protein
MPDDVRPVTGEIEVLRCVASAREFQRRRSGKHVIFSVEFSPAGGIALDSIPARKTLQLHG